MDTSYLKFVRKYFNRDKLKLDRKVIIFLFFTLVSAIFWFLNALSKDYTTEIEYPVKYINLPEDKVLVDELPVRMTLKVNAYGFILLKYKFSLNLEPVIVDVANLPLKNFQGQKSRYYVLTSFIKDRIGTDLEDDVKIMDIKPDSLIFHFSTVIKKRVPVVADIDMAFEQQFMQCGKVVSIPDSIDISGPQTIVDTITRITTEHLDLGTLDKTTRRNVACNRIEGINISEKRVVVEIPVEKFTEKKVNVPVKIKNLPLGTSIMVYPKEVTVSCMVGLSQFDKLSAADFVAEIDYNSTKDNISNKMQVALRSQPPHVKTAKIWPKSVEYIIEKND